MVVEVEGVFFDYIPEDNLFSTLITFSDVTDFEVFESDAVLVYRHDGFLPIESVQAIITGRSLWAFTCREDKNDNCS